MGHGAIMGQGTHHVSPAVKAQAAGNGHGEHPAEACSEGSLSGSLSTVMKPLVLLAPDAAGASAAPSLSGGLAARRNRMGGLSVAIDKGKDMSKGDVVQMSSGSAKTISVCDRFTDFYMIGKEVMPSSNTGMDVLFANRISDGKEVVIKTRQKSNSFTSKNEEQEWRRSTEMLLNLPESGNIAQVYEVKEDNTTYYVVMEKVDGMDLFEVLHSEGRLPLGETKAILRQLLRAVEDLHAKGCIHKDLKLENVMVDLEKSPSVKGMSPKSGKKATWGHESFGDAPESPTVVKLIDFDTVETFSPKLRAKSVVGTDQYIAQEAYAGHYSFASDVFAVGVIAYRLISGRFPFKNSMFDDEPGENWVGSPKMKVIQDRLKHYHIDFSAAPWPAEPKARDLVRWMLHNNEKERPTAHQALHSSFFEVTGQTPALPQGPWGSRMK